MSHHEGTSSSNGIASVNHHTSDDDSNSRGGRADHPATGGNGLHDTTHGDTGEANSNMYVLQHNDLEQLLARAQATNGAPQQSHGNGLQGLGEIPWYSGDDAPAGATFEDWLATFELIAEVNRWSEARKFSILPIRLKGTAKEVYQGLDKTRIANYTLMVAELKAVLAASSTRTVPLTQLANLMHEPGNSVIQFG